MVSGLAGGEKSPPMRKGREGLLKEADFDVDIKSLEDFYRQR